MIDEVRFTLLRDRPAADAALVAQWLFDEWGRESGNTLAGTIDRLLDTPDCPPTLLAVEGHRPLGVVGFRRYQSRHQQKPSLWVNSLFVVSSHRRLGVGGKLLSQAVERARRFEADIFVYTSAVAFYQRHGWRLDEQTSPIGPWVLSRRV